MKIELKHALRLWQKEQKPKLDKFHDWLSKHNYEIPSEGTRHEPKIWMTGICEEGVNNPEFKGLRCGRIEISKVGDDYPAEYSVCLPTELWDEIANILENY